MKVSYTNSRAQGSARHNDRKFDVTKTEHIDPGRTGENRYWCIYDGMTFDEAERKFYDEHYGPMLEARNRNQHGNSIDMDELRKMLRYCPEEVILQIGNAGDKPVDPALFDECFDQYMNQLYEWNRTHGSHMHILDWAVHKDEATVHAHIRRIFDYTDKDGILKIGLDKALMDAGVGLPDPNMPPGRRNNRKMEFDRIMRDRWADICEEHGVEVDRVPLPARHLKISEYKRDRWIEEAKIAMTNTDMVRGIMDQTMGDIPAEKLVERDGVKYVSESAEEYGRLLEISIRLAAYKEEEAANNRQAVAIKEETVRILKETAAVREATLAAAAEAAQLRKRIADAGLLAQVERIGAEALREPTELELEFIGEPGRAYDPARFSSAKEAMDALERMYSTSLNRDEPDGQVRI